MGRVIILGATGALGRHVLRQAVGAAHDVTVFVRTPSKLPPEASGVVSVHTGDLGTHVPLDLIKGQDALINCAGHVADGEAFVALFDRIVTAVDSLPLAEQPVCWFLAGAALLDLDPSGRRGVDLPQVTSTYWPHRANFERLGRSRLDWRLLCPGPMVEERAVGLDRLRISMDAIPVLVPAYAATLARRVGRASLRVADSPDDRALRRRGGPHARESRSRERDVATARRLGAARGHARTEGAVVAPDQGSTVATAVT